MVVAFSHAFAALSACLAALLLLLAESQASFSLIKGISPRVACLPNASRHDQQGQDSAVMTNTTDRLRRLRLRMKSLGYHAYIVPSTDDHQSEYTSPYDRRLEYIAGFTGSAGTAVILRDKAALWTDGRYFEQAEMELDCNWILVRMLRGTVSIPKWLSLHLPPRSRVGVDPRILEASKWQKWQERLDKHQITLAKESGNLVDDIWTRAQGRPPVPNDPVQIHPLKYAGVAWKDKVNQLREHLISKAIDSIIVTALDEVAWLFNLRGSDVPHTPVFKAFAFVSMDEIRLYINQIKLGQDALYHLGIGNCTISDLCVKLRDYELIYTDLRITEERVLVPLQASYAIFNLVPEDRRFFEISPITLMKSVKNAFEIEGMKNAHIRDAAAISELVAQLEDEMKEGKPWDELKAAARLTELRRKQALSRGDSFQTISAFGSNAAIIHYRPREATNRRINRSSLYLLDTGGQYLDGTTDITRTFHFGRPTDPQKEAYTRVLLGTIELMRAIFPEGTLGADLAILPRQHLYSVGLDYLHGTSHGIGHYLNIHEGPVSIPIVSVATGTGSPLKPGMFLSNEPGYYEPGNFGVRLETTMMVVNVETKHRFNGKQFLGFQPVIFLPFESKLIKLELLEQRHVQWLNEYNIQTRQVLGAELSRQRKTRALEWVMDRTRFVMPVQAQVRTGTATPVNSRETAPLLSLFLLLLAPAVIPSI